MCCDAEFSSSWARLPSCFYKHPLKRDFLNIYLTTFSKSVILEIQKLWGSSVFWKWSKFNIDFKNGAENGEKFFCFCHKCISIGNIKLSLLRMRYLSLAANVFTSSPRFSMSIIETFSNSVSLLVTSEYDKGAVMQNLMVVGHVYHIACITILWNGTF